MEIERKVSKHVLVVSYPAQGLINPMLQFSKRLVSEGLKVTFVTTVSVANLLQPASSIGSINLDVISDGYDDEPFAQNSCSDSYYATFRTVGSETLAGLIIRCRNSSQPVNCIVYASFLPWVLDVAKEFGLVAAVFFTQPCAVNYIYECVHRGVLRLPISSTPVSIPGLPLLELRDFPTFISDPGYDPASLEILTDQFSNLDKADCVLVNSFYKLEDEVVDVMSKKCPLLTIGPTIPSIYLDKFIEEDDKDYDLNLFPLIDQSNCTNWLTCKPSGSVAYVSFGSMVELRKKQVEELAWALKRSGFCFLWVLRASERPKLPKDFEEEVGDEKCRIVNWSNQLRILSHEAVGCFVTHSGWNSTIEALSSGVTMVAMPQWSDETTNAKFVEDVWKVGVRAKMDEDGIVRREEIEFCIKEVMQGKKGTEMKKNAKRWRELAIEAIGESGTSGKNIHEFASRLMSCN